MGVKRGELWWASLPDPSGSGPGYRRPVLVIQADSFNRSRIPTVIALTLSTNLALASAPGNVLLPAQRSGLPRDSVINVSQVVTVDRSLLTEQAGRLDPRRLRAVEEGLRLSLGL